MRRSKVFYGLQFVPVIKTILIVYPLKCVTMRVIETSTHGYLDYLVGVLLIVAPWAMGFAAGGAETSVPVILGAGTILYSLFTDYELSLSHSIPMRVHLLLDLAAGILLAVSPWLFGFADLVWAPHLVIGLFEIIVSLITKRVPYHNSRLQRHTTVVH
jgi:hypothetical protein